MQLRLKNVLLASFVLIVCLCLYYGDDDDVSTPTENSKLPSDFKFILTWTETPKNIPLHGWDFPGLDGFQAAGCEESRCFLTNNRSYLGT